MALVWANYFRKTMMRIGNPYYLASTSGRCRRDDILKFDTSLRHPIAFANEIRIPSLEEQYENDFKRSKDYLLSIHHKVLCENDRYRLPNNSGYRLHFLDNQICNVCPD